MAGNNGQLGVFTLGVDQLGESGSTSSTATVALGSDGLLLVVGPAFTTYSGDPLTERERTDLRRFCGYENYGPGNAGRQGWRFFREYGELEYRANNCTPEEAANLRKHMAECYALEDGYQTAAQIMQVDAVKGGTTRNKAELRDREALFAIPRRRLCTDLGIPPGPGLGQPGIRIVV